MGYILIVKTRSRFRCGVFWLVGAQTFTGRWISHKSKRKLMSSIKNKCLDLIPSAIASRIFGLLSDIHFPKRAQKFINRSFVLLSHINANEAEHPIEEYESLNDLFTRALIPGARNIENDSLISPVDGKLTAFGKVEENTILTVKNQHFDIDELIGTNAENDWIFGSYYFVIYLSPSNYHRIHAPLTASVTHMSYIPGRLLPVNRLGLALTGELFPTNERLTTIFRADSGRRAALVKVGATCVGKITTTYDDYVTNAVLRRKPIYKEITNTKYNIGDELATFNLGSTVVLFVESEGFTPSPNLVVDSPIQMGNALGVFDGSDVQNNADKDKAASDCGETE